MKFIHHISCVILGALALLASSAALADYPDRPVRVIVPFAAGAAEAFASFAAGAITVFFAVAIDASMPFSRFPHDKSPCQAGGLDGP